MKINITENEILKNESFRMVLKYAFFKMQNKENEFSLEDTEEFLKKFMSEYDAKVVSEKKFASITDNEIHEAKMALKEMF